MKKIVFLMLIAAVGLTSAHAQFEKGTKTLSANVTGLGLNFTKASDGGGLDDVISFGLMGKGNYFVADRFALTAGIGFEYATFSGDADDTNTFNFEIGARYYVVKSLYGSLSYAGSKTKDLDYENLLKVGVGYTLYINDNVFFEPELYFNQGLGDIDIYSNLGISVGIGVKF